MVVSINPLVVLSYAFLLMYLGLHYDIFKDFQRLLVLGVILLTAPFLSFGGLTSLLAVLPLILVNLAISIREKEVPISFLLLFLLGLYLYAILLVISCETGAAFLTPAPTQFYIY